jgi:hypothetical protein
LLSGTQLVTDHVRIAEKCTNKYNATMSASSDSTVKVTAIEPCGDRKVCITMELVVDVNRLVDISSQMLSVAVKGAAAKKKK